MFSSHSCCNAKIYGKTVLNEEIPVNKYEKKIDHMSKLVETIFIVLKVLKLWVKLWSIFHCNVNSEFMFDEQWMKKTSQDSTLDFFWFLSKNFFSKIWVAKFRVWLIWGVAYLQVFTVSNKTMNKVTTNNQFKLQFYLIQKFSEINVINSWIPKFCQAVAGLIVKDIHVTQIDL